MQNPTNQAEAASIPTETAVVSEQAGPNLLNPTFTVRRKAAKRSERWYQNISTPLPPSLQKAEEIPARKKPRLLDAPLPATTTTTATTATATTTDEADRNSAPPDISVGLLPPPLPPPAFDNDDANSDRLSTDTTQPNDAGAATTTTAVTGKWKQQEDADLISAVANTDKKLRGAQYRIDWLAVAALIPGGGRTATQCRKRWRNAVNPSIIPPATGSSGMWSQDEDSQLLNSVKTNNSKDWGAIALLVPSRTQGQCYQRWHFFLSRENAIAAGRKTGIWEEDENIKLKNVMQTHSGEDWDAIAAMIPGRSKHQCRQRWKDSNPSTAMLARHKGKFSENEDLKLQKAVQMHHGKEWASIAMQVPGRTSTQCWNRWHLFLNPSISLTHGRTTGKWGKLEDINLENAVHAHNGKNWPKIAALVPGRTKRQCYIRWETRKAQFMT
jgi:hypothetical protein